MPNDILSPALIASMVGNLSVPDLIRTMETFKQSGQTASIEAGYAAWIAHNQGHPLLYAVLFNYSVCLSDAGKLDEAQQQLEKAIAINQPDPSDPIDVLAKVGGFDIAGMAGVFLAGAAHGVPVVMDGFISCVAALLAARIAPFAKDYMIASHVSKEPAAHLLLAELGKEAFLHCDMCLGEGTGAIMLFPILDQANAVYRGMATFDEAQIETYVPLT